MKKASLNLLYLTVIQVSNAVLPLIVFPHILGVLGAERYSDIVLSESIMFVLYAFILYSFEVNGVSDIVGIEDKESTKELSLVFSKVLTVRLLILGAFLILILLAGLFIETSFFYLLLAWMLYPLGYILQSSYFFLAVEDNFFLAVSVLSSRIMAVLCIFFFVNKIELGYLVPLIIGVIFVFAGLCSFIYAINKYKN